MRRSLKFAIASIFIVTPALAANDQTNDLALTNSGPVTDLPLPDPSHIPIRFGKDIKWKDGEGETPLFGDPKKPGLYGFLIRWKPGHNSEPHFHSSDRYIYVVSGTWWVSASSVYDKDKMYPVPAGSFVTNIANTIHWDGAKESTGPCVLMLVGEGPMETTHYVPKDVDKAPEGQQFVAGK